MTAWTRRRMLRTAVAGSGVALCPARGVFAQSGISLLRAPKVALVIGNSKYGESPLRNPGNDARGMADALKATGFDVALGIDLTQDAMRERIRAYTDALVKTKAVGVFYFAGHGVQIAWRNYLIPISAVVEQARELQQHAIDVNSVIDGIRRAGNPMNIIILDACRDNPFGRRAAEQKGLSQLDAPPGTLLAYATAPGNTAEDGTGDNGLYTENLLREIRVPELKVEDVFKRVRLSVRRQSSGQQIPWESTSLEEDFWFLPPKQVRKLAEEEAQRAFKEESAVWERAQNARDPSPLEEYLTRYPSGHFSELAQLRLDGVLRRQGERKVEVVSAPRNPYTKGSAKANTAYRVGDTYQYRVTDVLTGVQQREAAYTVRHINETQVVYGTGGTITDLLGNYRRWGGALWGENQIVPAEFVVGKRWNTRFDYWLPNGKPTVVELEVRIADRENVTVPAGAFKAFRVEAKGWRTGEGVNIQWNWKLWFAPEQVRRPISWEWQNRDGRSRRLVTTDRYELVTFKQS